MCCRLILSVLYPESRRQGAQSSHNNTSWKNNKIYIQIVSLSCGYQLYRRE
uniref:Uncharacterized protein n=1 Tax=Arundo donax TaxID=35708 RepID=A0A0A9FJE2_ARUDO